VDFSSRAPGVVIDIGAAFGVATLPALAAGATVIAQDIEGRHLRTLWERCPAPLRRRLVILPAPFPSEPTLAPESIGAAHAANLLNYLSGPEIERGAATLYDWIVPGGKVFIVCGTPYAGNLGSFPTVYEERKRSGLPWPGMVDDLSVFSTHPSLEQLPQSLHLLDDEVLTRTFRAAGFVIEKIEMYNRANLPSYLRFDGRENVGMVARKRASRRRRGGGG
jgi:hypothetical protein